VGIIVAAIYFYRRYRARSRRLSFNRDLMVRQRTPSVSSIPGTDLGTVDSEFNPYQGLDEKPPLRHGEDSGEKEFLVAY
jgi:hypothetical protein